LCTLGSVDNTCASRTWKLSLSVAAFPLRARISDLVVVSCAAEQASGLDFPGL